MRPKPARTREQAATISDGLSSPLPDHSGLPAKPPGVTKSIFFPISERLGQSHTIIPHTPFECVIDRVAPAALLRPRRHPLHSPTSRALTHGLLLVTKPSDSSNGTASGRTIRSGKPRSSSAESRRKTCTWCASPGRIRTGRRAPRRSRSRRSSPRSRPATTSTRRPARSIPPMPVPSRRSRAGGGFGLDEMTGSPNLTLVPDPSTFRVLPWAPGIGWVLGDEYFNSGVPFHFSPRQLLRRAAQAAGRQGHGLPRRPGDRVVSAAGRAGSSDRRATPAFRGCAASRSRPRRSSRAFPITPNPTWT